METMNFNTNLGTPTTPNGDGGTMYLCSEDTDVG
jgi:hypothetical protein